MKEVTRYVSFDGIEHKTAEECRAHEAGQSHLMLVGLAAEEIVSAMIAVDWKNPDDPSRPLADAIEHVGMAIAKSRREAGELKRQRKKKDDQPPAAPTDRDLVAEAKAELDARVKARESETLLTDDGVNWKPADEFV